MSARKHRLKAAMPSRDPHASERLSPRTQGIQTGRAA